MPKARKNMLAAIHLGSEQVHMEIIQYDNQGQVKILERLTRSTTMGEETFKIGKVSFQSVNEVCNLLKGFKRLINEYRTQEFQLIATTALREAQNRQYIIDQIKVKTGFDVQVIDMLEEVFLKYKVLFKILYEQELIDKEEGALFTDITSGGLGITLYGSGGIQYLQNIHMGTLRIKENFTKKQRESLHFLDVLEEYIYGSIEVVADAIANHQVRYLILSGVETQLLLEMLKRNNQKNRTNIEIIPLAEFQDLYSQVRSKNMVQIMHEFQLTERKAEMALPTLVLYNKIVNLIKTEQIMIPQVDLVNGMVNDIVEQRTKSKWLNIFNGHIVSCARMLANKYSYYNNHSKFVEKHALFLFDRLIKLHGYGGRERLFLQVSSILHDIGKFVNLRRHYFYSYRLIISSDIMGFSDEEREIIANIAYYHSKVTPSNNDPNYASLSSEAKVIVSKLSAILRLADALDSSHNQKIRDIDVIWKGNHVEILALTNEDISLEEWTFNYKASFFEEVFGLQALVRRKGGIK